ncbi:hypothetical protein BDZ45DRAFT_669469 [Acephala macrosclerotiorum]|nr:hypothetical protein BDZ45DRAFT_669469 [Acephala macrosclerotiorum]
MRLGEEKRSGELETGTGTGTGDWNWNRSHVLKEDQEPTASIGNRNTQEIPPNPPVTDFIARLFGTAHCCIWPFSFFAQPHHTTPPRVPRQSIINVLSALFPAFFHPEQSKRKASGLTSYQQQHHHHHHQHPSPIFLTCISDHTRLPERVRCTAHTLDILDLSRPGRCQFGIRTPLFVSREKSARQACLVIHRQPSSSSHKPTSQRPPPSFDHYFFSLVAVAVACLPKVAASQRV